MRVLVACEFSGIVRDAFIAAGHDAWSVDLLPSERPGPHYRGDVRRLFDPASGFNPRSWDLMVAHPPCQHIAVSGARYFPAKIADGRQADALAFVQFLMDAPVQRIAIENPVSVISSHIRKPDQIVQPWWFGTGETKATCLWLKNLPLLTPTNIVDGRVPRVHYASPGPDRWKERSRTDPNLAAAMADQWGVADLTLGLSA